MKLLVGLGNPGPKYAAHRHNVGFMAVDAIAARHGFGPWRGRFQGQAAEGRLAGEPVLLLKPMTYMNESGRAVGEAKRFHKLDSADIVVFHDEIDLAPGKVRVKAGGGHAGHNGLRSIAAQIGADFRRVRIGVGHPGDKNRVQAYVLRDFAKADRAWLEPLLDAIAEAAPHLAAGADDRFMNAVALSAQAGPSRAPAPVRARKTKARASAPAKGKAPSQRDLARAAARRGRDTPSPAEREAKPQDQPTSGEGKLAALLRRWLGRQ